MFLLVLILSIVVIGIVLGAFKPSNYKDSGGDVDLTGIWRPVVTLVASLVIASFQPIAVTRIDAGHVGIKVSNVGDSRGVGKTAHVTGWVFYNDWTSRIYEFPVHQQHIDYPENGIITRGGFQTTIKPSFNYSLNAGNVGDMFQNLRKNLKEVEQEWLKTSIVGAVNDVANLYTVDSIFNHRAEFERDIVIEANKRVSRWFTISQLRTNIAPPEALRDAIEKKTKAIQDVQVAENNRRVAVAVAETKMATARGDSAEAVILASGRAEAMKREQEAARMYLTPLYVDYLRAQKWDGQYPTTLLGGGNANVLLGLK